MKEIKSNGFEEIIAQTIEEMKSEQGSSFLLEHVNLAELERRTGITRARLRRWKKNGFTFKCHKSEGKKAKYTILNGYTAYLDDLLGKGVTNSSVCLRRLQEIGYTGGLTTVKDYISSHKHLVPAKRQMVAPQGNRGRRFLTEAGEAYQMDWGFTKVQDHNGKPIRH